MIILPNSYGSWRTGIQIDNIYPVGSIYISVNSTNPGSLFGGSWEAVGGRFLIGADSTYTAGATGGAATMAHTHPQVATTSGAPSNNTSGGPSTANTGATTLTVSQIPAHKHNLSYRTGVVAGGSSGLYYFDVGTAGTWYGETSPSFGSVGGGGSHTHTLNSHTHTLSSHTHSTSATTTGAASNTNNMPPYLVVYMWKRIS